VQRIAPESRKWFDEKELDFRFADSMDYLSENPEFASYLGITGRKLVESRYTWEIISDRYLKIYL